MLYKSSVDVGTSTKSGKCFGVDFLKNDLCFRFSQFSFCIVAKNVHTGFFCITNSVFDCIKVVTSVTNIMVEVVCSKIV